MKKVLCFALCAVMGAALFAGGSKAQSKDTIRIMWWGGDARHQKTLEVIELFKKANPGVNVTAEYSGMDGYFDKLNVQFAGGRAPDVIQFGGNLQTDYAAKDLLLPLDPYVGGLLDAASIDKAAIDEGTVNGKLYGICLGTNTAALVYNKALLDRIGAPPPPAGASWDALVAWGRQVKPKLPAGTWVFTDNCGNQANYISYWLGVNGTPVYHNKATGLTPAAGEKWFQMWADLRKEGLIPDAETTASYPDTGVDNSLLVAGKAVVNIIWSNQLVGYQGAMKDTLSFVPLPELDKNQVTIQPSQYFAVSKKSANPEAAVKFINFFVNNADAGLILGNDRGIPASQKVRDLISPKVGPVDKAIYDLYALINGHTTPRDENIPNSAEFENTLKLIAQRVAFAQITPKDGGQQLYDLVTRLIGK